MEFKTNIIRLLLILTTVFFLLLFFGVSIFFTQLNDYQNLRMEYDASTLSYALYETFLLFGIIGDQQAKPYIVGFGVYTGTGELIYAYGTAPSHLDMKTARGFPYIAKDKETFYFIKEVGLGRRRKGENIGSQHQGDISQVSVYLFLEHSQKPYRRERLFSILYFSLYLFVLLMITLFAFLLFARVRRMEQAEEEKKHLIELGEAARVLTHEIKNPLSVIQVQQKLLSRRLGGFDGDYGNSLKVLKEEVQRIAMLTDRLKVFLHDPIGTRQTVSIGPFLRELVKKLGYPVLITGNVPDGTSIFIDPEKLRSILENCIKNAYQSMIEQGRPRSSVDGGPALGRHPGSQTINQEAGVQDHLPDIDDDLGNKVELNVHCLAKQVIIDIVDRGPGVPVELREKIFLPFFTTKIKGSGTGLSITKRFMEAAQGTIEFHDGKEGGAICRLTFPLVQGA